MALTETQGEPGFNPEKNGQRILLSEFFGKAEREHPTGAKELVAVIGTLVPETAKTEVTREQLHEKLTPEKLGVGFSVLNAWLFNVLGGEGVKGFENDPGVLGKLLLSTAKTVGVRLPDKAHVAGKETQTVLRAFSRHIREGLEVELTPRDIVGALLVQSIGSQGIAEQGSKTVRTMLEKATNGRLDWLREALGVPDMKSEAPRQKAVAHKVERQKVVWGKDEEGAVEQTSAAELARMVRKEALFAGVNGKFSPLIEAKLEGHSLENQLHSTSVQQAVKFIYADPKYLETVNTQQHATGAFGTSIDMGSGALSQIEKIILFAQRETQKSEARKHWENNPKRVSEPLIEVAIMSVAIRGSGSAVLNIVFEPPAEALHDQRRGYVEFGAFIPKEIARSIAEQSKKYPSFPLALLWELYPGTNTPMREDDVKKFFPNSHNSWGWGTAVAERFKKASALTTREPITGVHVAIDGEETFHFKSSKEWNAAVVATLQRIDAETAQYARAPTFPQALSVLRPFVDLGVTIFARRPQDASEGQTSRATEFYARAVDLVVKRLLPTGETMEQYQVPDEIGGSQWEGLVQTHFQGAIENDRSFGSKTAEFSELQRHALLGAVHLARLGQLAFTRVPKGMEQQAEAYRKFYLKAGAVYLARIDPFLRA